VRYISKFRAVYMGIAVIDCIFGYHANFTVVEKIISAVSGSQRFRVIPSEVLRHSCQAKKLML